MITPHSWMRLRAVPSHSFFLPVSLLAHLHLEVLDAHYCVRSPLRIEPSRQPVIMSAFHITVCLAVVQNAMFSTLIMLQVAITISFYCLVITSQLQESLQLHSVLIESRCTPEASISLYTGVSISGLDVMSASMWRLTNHRWVDHL